jgi:hypothetical protein
MNNLRENIYDSIKNDLGLFDDKDIGAWLFFNETIGVDYSAIYSCWRRVPELFISANTLSRNFAPLKVRAEP